MFDMVLLKFFTQGATIYTQVGCGLGLVFVAVIQHGLQHRLLYFGNNRFKQVAGYLAIEIFQILADCLFYRLL